MSKTTERIVLKRISACHKDNKVNITSKLDVSLNIAEKCILGWAKEEKKISWKISSVTKTCCLGPEDCEEIWWFWHIWVAVRSWYVETFNNFFLHGSLYNNGSHRPIYLRWWNGLGRTRRHDCVGGGVVWGWTLRFPRPTPSPISPFCLVVVDKM